MPPLISICIPIYNAEAYFDLCLESIVNQEVKDFEVVVLNDGSSGKNAKGWGCKKIVKHFSKKIKNPVTYIEHSKNLGLVEGRRDLVLAAKGKYILMVDSDDILPPDALKFYADQLKIKEYDIVHGNSKSYKEENGVLVPTEERIESFTSGEFFNREIYRISFIEKKSSTFLWGKAISREVYIKAFDMIPYTLCNYIEDYLIFFFVALNAESFVAVDKTVYNYRVDSGISAKQKVNFERWKSYCNVTSAFSVLFLWFDEQKNLPAEQQMSEEDFMAVRNFSYEFLYKSVNFMYREFSDEELPQARELLCEYWGESFVEKIEREQGVKS